VAGKKTENLKRELSLLHLQRAKSKNFLEGRKTISRPLPRRRSAQALAACGCSVPFQEKAAGHKGPRYRWHPGGWPVAVHQGCFIGRRAAVQLDND